MKQNTKFSIERTYFCVRKMGLLLKEQENYLQQLGNCFDLPFLGHLLALIQSILKCKVSKQQG